MKRVGGVGFLILGVVAQSHSMRLPVSAVVSTLRPHVRSDMLYQGIRSMIYSGMLAQDDSTMTVSLTDLGARARRGFRGSKAPHFVRLQIDMMP